MNFDTFFQTATGRAPYSFQRAFATGPVLPDLLEAPTGSGKTATAVLGWLFRRLHGTPEQRAEGGRRLVFCLPMRTLVEQTERSVRAWSENLGLVDTVGVHALLGGAVDDAWEKRPDGTEILIGTQDQLLSRALMRGYAMSRYMWPVHFALLNSDCTWIMDEVQLMGVGASTAAQLQAFREHFRVAGSTRTVWMTATLAEERLRTVDVRRPFVRLPFTADDPALARRLGARKSLMMATATIEAKGSLALLAKEIGAAHEKGTLTLVVVNRVGRAQALFDLLRKDPSIEATALIHSRFRPAERRQIQEHALGGAFTGVLVATQAVEAGVDISAKTLFTELAPWSSLVQRFGRLNRAGEFEESRAFWIDVDANDDDLCLPYDGDALRSARGRLSNLTDVGPSTLGRVPRDPEEPSLPVIRKKDLLELFDTEPDLSGHDIDVSRYIRTSEERDVQVAWRSLGDEPPRPDSPDLARDELCSVPFYQLAKLLKNRHRAWRYDGLRRKWTAVDAERLIPGLAVVVDVSAGGYDPDRGFTGDSDDIPASLEGTGTAPDYDEADVLTYGSADYVTLELHAQDTAEEMGILLRELERLISDYATGSLLLDAARWHDAGKAHPAFQEMLTSALLPDDARRTGGPWAKSNGAPGRRNARRFFRHELASALAWLNEGRPDLGAFLVAAHHGKVRLSLRARPGEEPPADAPSVRFAHGIHEGDRVPAASLGDGVMVPEQTLSLACMELGGTGSDPSWADRMLDVLEQVGPFRLAYAEALIRVADWRASAKRSARAEARAGGTRG